ncbi:MAG: beta strand repeat-containing protein, partial [Nitrososphaerales archaeon]
TVTSLNTGSFTATITIPNNAVVGDRIVTATDNSNPPITASATFTVTSGTSSGITVSPTSGPTSTSVTVSGTNFTTNASITIKFDTTLLTTTVSTSTGSFTTTITIPNNAIQGSHIISATDGAKIESTTFTVTSGTASGITLSPTSGLVGTVVTIFGVNFAANTAITIKFDNNPITTSPSTIISTSTGSFTATITIPNNAAVGSHITSAADNSKTESATFTVVATSIILSPTSGVAGSTVTVTGTGFVSGATITIKIDSTTLTTTPASIVASSSGGFSAQITIPTTANSGTRTISASDTTGKTATATFNVLVSGTITLSTNAGNRGASVTVTGSNFNPNSAVTVKFDNNPTTTNPASVTTATSGSFTATVTIPLTASTGTHTITATDASGRMGLVTFTVAAGGVITLSPTTGISGTEVTVTGSNFTANTRVTIKFETILVATTPATVITGTSGGFLAKFDIPAGVTGGVHTVFATDEAGKIATATFTVQGTGGESITISPTSGSVGTTVTVTGSNFVANTAVTIKFDGNAITTNPATVTTTSTGTFTATITIPNIVAGSHTVAVTVGSKTATATFTISQSQSTSITISPSSGTVGTSITVTGSGFSPTKGVTINLDGSLVATSTTSSTGTFNALFTILATVTAGSHTVTANDGANTASATLSISGGGSEVVNVSQLKLVDQTGAALSSPSVGMQVLIQSDVKNTLSTDQQFTYIVQIKDSGGATIMISWMIGTLPAGKEYAVAQSWLVENKGQYTAEVFVWQSLSNPVILAPMQKTNFNVQ